MGHRTTGIGPRCAAGQFDLLEHDARMRALSHDMLAAAGEHDIWREAASPSVRRWHDSAIVFGPDRQLAGSVWLLDAEIAFFVALAWRGRGIARAAVRAVCADAFGKLGYAALHAYVERNNIPSARDAAGFRRAGARNRRRRFPDPRYRVR